MDERIVGVRYTTDRTYVEYFDAEAKALASAVREAIGDLSIRFLDESRDRRFYLVHANSDVDSGAYYRFDRETGIASRVTHSHPWLVEGHTLAPMSAIRYPVEEGIEVPAYVTTPPRKEGQRLPLVVLPHGGPFAQDRWGFDWLAQFLAAQGYVVLQANYRGSTGYGIDWVGDGAFKGWRNVVGDIDAGVDHLIEKGLVDPDRICTVGWSFGGYASLMLGIAKPERYRCVVSVAGVTHPYRLYSESSLTTHLGRYARVAIREIVPTRGEEVSLSSPLERVSEFKQPVLLFHGDLDRNVPVDHSRDLAKALERADKSVDYVEFDDADHQIERPDQRIAMLQRIGDFLHQHLKRKTAQTAKAP
jgi:dipeptidyl aminopeptidase/acylaminoacyl peptidase